MSNIIKIHIGQAGVQIGKKIWEQMAVESGIDGCGVINKNATATKPSFCFDESASGTFSARGIFMDGDPGVIEDNILSGPRKRLFNRDTCLQGTAGAANCYARGKFRVSMDIKQDVFVTVRRSIEACDNLTGFQIFHSVSGGTGSGMSTFLLNYLQDIVPTTDKFMFSIFPSAVIDPNPTANYNAILCFADSHNSHSIRFVFDNQSLYKEVTPILDQRWGVTFSHVNHVLAVVDSRMTAGERFFQNGSLNQDRLPTNLIPFPTHKMVSSAFVSMDSHDSNVKHSEHSITAEAYLNNHELCNIDIFSGTYFTSCLQYCVNEVNYRQILEAAACVKSAFSIPFVEWIPTSFGIGFVDCEFNRNPADSWYRLPGKTCLKLSNHSNITANIKEMLEGYNKMLDQRAYVSWYISEGMEEGEFNDCMENVTTICEDLTTMGKDDE